ncbi:MAG: arsenic resistance N-acetyltransferase ArsN2 [Methylobacteriaceae bacterium]|jgi:arsenate reductase|nr:arsenic resistance N-acetyltransferase ArsN2 [Methylobacteriaceae bacterium]
MSVTLYHNRNCGTSRAVLALIRAAGIEPLVVEYLKTPPSRATLAALVKRSGLPARALLRQKEALFRELRLGDPALSNETALDALAAHPALLNRPVVVSDRGVVIARPPDAALAVLPQLPRERLLKENGVPYLKLTAIPAADSAFRDALAAEHLTVDDLGEPNQMFFAAATLDDVVVGYGGYQRRGSLALLRSLTVLPGFRGKHLGASLTALILHRALMQDRLTEAWLLTMTAAPFFRKIGFKTMDRKDVPEDIRGSTQFSSLCPVSSTLMRKALDY